MISRSRLIKEKVKIITDKKIELDLSVAVPESSYPRENSNMSLSNLAQSDVQSPHSV
jgi:hypothetical protein